MDSNLGLLGLVLSVPSSWHRQVLLCRVGRSHRGCVVDRGHSMISRVTSSFGSRERRRHEGTFKVTPPIFRISM